MMHGVMQYASQIASQQACGLRLAKEDNMPTLEQLRSDAHSKITDHWASCEESGLPHRPGSRDRMLAAYDGFFAAIGQLSSPVAKETVLEPIRQLYEKLHTVNRELDDGLLETDERELLVPIIMDAVVAVGVGLDQFEDGEPGSEFRDF